MQHKSLFAALLCGALCLTACLKNEESPSVTQVRNAKAHELESIAELNKANAAATITLANAEAKLKEAQVKLVEADAKYREAEAKKVEAETALLRVQADILAVQVLIAQEDLKIKQVELQAKEAELEALKAQYKAAIAAAEAEEAYWIGVKEQVAAELEIMAMELEAELIAAQKNVAETQAAYDKILHDIDVQLAQQYSDDLQDLRDRIEELATAYTEASAELIQANWAFYQLNDLRTQYEGQLMTRHEVLAQMTIKNNNEIARIQKYIEYLKTYQDLSSEEIKDALVDVNIAWDSAYQDYQATVAEATAKLKEYDANVPNPWGVDSTLPEENDVTYSFTQDFFVPGPGEENLSDLYEFPDTRYCHYNEAGELIDAALVTYTDPEDGLTKQVLVIGELDSWGDIDPEKISDIIPMYSYYDANYGVNPWGVKISYERYPDLGEGIAYDERTPYTVITHKTQIPLEINKAGYQAYVDWANVGAETYRDKKEASLREDIADLEDEIARVNEYLATAAPIAEVMDAKLEEAFNETLEISTKLHDLYDAYLEARQTYYETYIVPNVVERTDAWWAYEEAQTAYQEAVDAVEPDVLIEWALDIINLTANVEYLTEYIAENPEDVKRWDLEVARAKLELDNALKELSDAIAAQTVAQNNYDVQKGKVDVAQANYNTAMTNYYDAWIAWTAAGEPLDEDNALFKAWKAAYVAWYGEDVAFDYWNQEWYWITLGGTALALQIENNNLLPLETALNSANIRVSNAEWAAGQDEEHYPGSRQQNYDQTVAMHPVNYLASKEAKLEEVQGKMDEYQQGVKDAKAVLEAALIAWAEVNGYDDTSVADAWTAYQTAVAEAGNPYIETLMKYAIITDPSDIDNVDWDEYIDTYDYADFYVWFYEWYYGTMESEADYYDLLTEAFEEGATSYMGDTFYWEFLDGDVPFENQSAMGVYFNYYYFQGYIESCEEEIDKIENVDIPAAYAECEATIEANNAMLTQLDAILANEAVYKSAIEKLNATYDEYVVLAKSAFDKEQVFNNLSAEREAMYMAMKSAQGLEEAIASCEAEIAELQAEVDTYAALLQNDEDLLSIVINPALTLIEQNIAVLEKLVASLKAELDEALAQLPAAMTE